MLGSGIASEGKPPQATDVRLTAHAPPLIETSDLGKSYGAVRALGPLSLRIPAGSLGLVGPNGAGKTTFLRLLLGLLHPDSGRASILGLDPGLQGLQLRELVGYMPEHECLIPDMTGVGLVSFMGRLSGLPPAVALGRAHDVLQFVGFHEERYRKISEYSYGMRQRVKLAQAIVHDPPLVLLDEPTAGLDPMGRDEMLKLLSVLAHSPGRSVVLCTHILSDVEGICDNLLVLDGGRSIAQGPLQELLTIKGNEISVRIKGDPAIFLGMLDSRGISYTRSLDELRITRPPGGEKELFEIAFETHTQIRSMGRSVRTVEDLFLELMGERPEGEL